MGQIHALSQVIATVGDQTADVEHRLLALVAPHGTIAFLDPPTNGTLAGIVGAIQDVIFVSILPSAIKGQTQPQAPAVEEQIA